MVFTIPLLNFGSHLIPIQDICKGIFAIDLGIPCALWERMVQFVHHEPQAIFHWDQISRAASPLRFRSLSTGGNYYIKNVGENEIQYIVPIFVIVHYIYTNYINFN